MTRQGGDQPTLGAQVFHADVGFAIDQGTTPGLGSNAGGNPIGWFPGGGMFYSHSVSPDLNVGVAVTGNFGSVVKYNPGWVGRAQEGALLGVSILPSAAWRGNENRSAGAGLNAMYGKLKNEVAVNKIVASDGTLSLGDNT
jgi:long-chain fatty acid transport protein